MQVYRDLDILSARPTEADMAAVPHALYGTIDGAKNHSVSLWLGDVKDEIGRTQAEGLLPVLVGGTGLYFKALTQGLSDIPTVSQDVRAQVRTWAQGQTPEALHAALALRDPATAAGLRPTDPQRILRALEVHAATGESLTSFQARRQAATVCPGTAICVWLALDRETVRSRIDKRFDGMIAAGALDEVAALAARRLDPALPVMRAIGVPSLCRHLAGDMALAMAIDEAKAASRHYIKRQETFLRHQLTGFRPVAADDAAAFVMSAFQSSV